MQGQTYFIKYDEENLSTRREVSEPFNDGAWKNRLKWNRIYPVEIWKF